ncbi:MAG: site-specific integrase [Phycisphaeraceae bacterium]|nr:site-specific integrase [Phycisphaeraceae bacterium]
MRTFRLRASQHPDERGRIVDIHSLRHTFNTHLSASGVHPRTAMATIRHSRIDLTMNYDVDPSLLDVAGAVNALPAFGRSSTAKR